jgi:hypothetical protein
MSELKVNKVTPRSGTTVTLGDSGDSVAIPAGVGFNGFDYRNIIINGDMQIAQRSTSVASITASSYYTADRWLQGIITAGTWTVSQSTDVPTGQGFATSMKFDCTTANASLSGDSLFNLQQRFEGQNLQYLKKGTASALSLTLSFWVKSNKTGTYIAELFDNDNSRSISKSYTIDVSNTWEKKTITFAGDTTGALDNNNDRSFNLDMWLSAGTDYTSGTLATDWESITSANRAVGQVNLADDTANEWYITGVQLEAGTTASDFEFLPIDVNLGRCQRYYERIGFGDSNSRYPATGGYANTFNVVSIAPVAFAVSKRAIPTLTSSGTRVFTNASSGGVNGASVSGFRLEIVSDGGGNFSGAYSTGGIAVESEL